MAGNKRRTSLIFEAGPVAARLGGWEYFNLLVYCMHPLAHYTPSYFVGLHGQLQCVTLAVYAK